MECKISYNKREANKQIIKVSTARTAYRAEN